MQNTVYYVLTLFGCPTGYEALTIGRKALIASIEIYIDSNVVVRALR